jgi:amino-acid N-acetyltransferase
MIAIIQEQLELERLKQFLQLNKLPYQDIDTSFTGKDKIFLGYYDEVGELIGSGGLELYGDAALLRSVAVKENQRGKELGKKIIDDLVSHAQKANIANIFLLTETAKDFFLKRGFEVIGRNEVPDSIKASSEFSHVCPASAVCMTYKIE